MWQLIGKTPMLELGNIMRTDSVSARLLAKLEGWNPAGSVKDRVALAMLAEAQAEGQLLPGGMVIEATSGNTGIGLCAVAAAQGYRCVIVMPENMSRERQSLMRAYGARVVLTPAEQGMQGALTRARELALEHPGSFLPRQFENPANPVAHYTTTGLEIWADTAGKVDVFVAGVGTGGTVTGVGRYLKEQNPAVRVIAVEPAESPLLSQGKAGPHGIQGIGPNFVPPVLDRSVVDDVMTVTYEEAVAAARRMGAEEGVLVGISSGAALAAALRLAAMTENTGKTVVALLPDSGERYLSTDLYG
jgi:cysteine synthase A